MSPVSTSTSTATVTTTVVIILHDSGSKKDEDNVTDG